MSRFRLLPALLGGLVIAVTATACRKSASSLSSTVSTAPDTLIPGSFITASGRFTHTDELNTLSLDVTQSGTSLSLSYSSQRRLPSGGNTGSSSGTGTAIPSPTAPWFIYVESTERFWYYDGMSELSSFYPEGGASGPVIYAGKLDRRNARVPPEVVLRLPDDLKKLLPPVEPPVKRPSL